MNKMEGLRAGVAEMRSVAQRLNQWANDLEQTVSDHLQVVRSSETSDLPSGESRRLSLRTNLMEQSLTEPDSARRKYLLPDRTLLKGKSRLQSRPHLKQLRKREKRSRSGKSERFWRGNALRATAHRSKP